MELSAEVQDLLQRFKTLPKPHEGSTKMDSVLKSIPTSYEMHSSRIQDNEVLNLDDINFGNDEYWLHGKPSGSGGSVQNWLYENHYDAKFTDPHINIFPNQSIDSFGGLSENALSAKKLFDSRTYTRPKKKFIRPSLDRYRDDYLERPSINKSIEKSNSSTFAKPLHFDLTQPMSCSRMFDNIANNAPDNDSFQNMSPPSLINSMCSSTFTTAMDSSIIRNDPVLREIRSADYKTEPLMLQSLQSLTESYSSINSDSAEHYLRRTLPQLLSAKTDSSEYDENFYSLTGSQTVLDDKLESDDVTLNLNDRNLEEFYYDTTKAALNNNTTNMKNLHATRNHSTILNSETKYFPIDALTGDNKLDYEVITNQYSNETFKLEDSNESRMKSSNDVTQQTVHNSEKRILNATFNKSREIVRDATFNKSLSPKTSSDLKDGPNRSIANGTFTRPKKIIPLNSNTTFNVNEFDKSQLNTGDYYNTNEQVFNGTLKKDKDRSKTRVIDTSTLRNLTFPKYGNGSGDSLDRLSNYSDSSRGSVGKMTMAEIDAIVEQQEQSLLMSTPKPAKSLSKLFDQRVALPSPIHRTLQFGKEHLSDSELSEEYSTARSSIKNKRLSMHYDNKTASSAINTTGNLNRSYKSMSNLKQPTATGRISGSLAIVKPTPSTANYGTYRKPSSTIASTRASSAISSTVAETPSYARSGSERNVPRAIGITSGTNAIAASGSTNLHTMGTQLKASYTSLRPTFAHLPHAQPPLPSQMAFRSESATAIGGIKANQTHGRLSVPVKSSSVQSVPTVSRTANGAIVKQRGLSALPRPVSGIPKPTSKLPGPKPLRPSTTKPLTNIYYSSNTMR